jgi:hypothetical protein
MFRKMLAAGMIVMALAGCSQTTRDLEDVPIDDPDKIEMYANVDSFPNVVRLCIDGVAFATTTRDYEPIMRVPEWDASFCGRSR